MLCTVILGLREQLVQKQEGWEVWLYLSCHLQAGLEAQLRHAAPP